jgi:tyrosyl-tRNA synthetase
MVVPEAVAQGIGVLGMKSMGSGVLLKSNTATPKEYIDYALNLPTSVVITGIDSMDILNQNLNIARTFKPLTQNQLQAMLAKTEKAAADGEYELFKTTSHFDSTAQHPDWLGQEPARVKQLDTGD